MSTPTEFLANQLKKYGKEGYKFAKEKGKERIGELAAEISSPEGRRAIAENAERVRTYGQVGNLIESSKRIQANLSDPIINTIANANPLTSMLLGGIKATPAVSGSLQFMAGNPTKAAESRTADKPSEKNIIYVTGADGKEVALDMNNPADVKRLQTIKAKVPTPVRKKEEGSTDQVSLVNANGVPQTGTDGSKLLARHEEEKKSLQESGIGNSLLQRLGIDSVRYGQFESNYLPGQQPTAGKVQKTSVAAKVGGKTPAEYLDSGKSTTNEAELPTKETNLVTSGVKPASDRAALGTRARYSQEFLADRPNMSDKYSESLTGLRAADSSKGLLYASGQYWRETGELDANNNPKYEKIEKGEYNAIKRGNQHALDFARDKIEDAKSIIKQGDNKNYDTDGFSIEDAKHFRMTPTQARAIGSGGYVETLIGGSEADQPEQSAVSPVDTEVSVDEDPGKTERLETIQKAVDRKKK